MSEGVTQNGITLIEEVEWRQKKAWEGFAGFFGGCYMKMIVIIAQSVFLMASVTLFWTTAALPVLFTPDNPLGRPITLHESDYIGHFYYIGAVMGPFLALCGVVTLGRKMTLNITYCIIPVTFMIFIFAKTIELYYICRVLQGIYLGVVVSVQPVFLAQLLKTEGKHFYLSLATVFGGVGMILTFLIGPLVPLLCLNVAIVLISVFGVILFVLAVPESPHYLVESKRKEEARIILSAIRKNNVEEELEQIEVIIKEKYTNSVAIKSCKTFFLATVPFIIQVLSGAIVLQTFTEIIFKQTTFELSLTTCTKIVICYQFCTVFLTPTLLYTKIFDIRSLFMLSLSGMGLSNLLLALYFMFLDTSTILRWLPFIGFIISIPFYNCGQDPIPLIVLSEIYPKRFDAVGAALTTTVYIFLFSIFSYMPMMFAFDEVSIGIMFLISGIFCVIGILFGKICFTAKVDDAKCN